MEPPRKLWKNATGHRRGIVVDDMTPIEAPTHYRRPPKSIARPESSASSPKIRGSSRHDSTPAVPPASSAQIPLPAASSPPQVDSHYQRSHRLNEDDSDEGEVRGDSAESDEQKYLITTEDGDVVSVADSPEARKRRQNTIAARRSRQRKLEYVRTLEIQVAELEKERDELKARSEKAEEKVQWLKEMLMDGRSAT